jgi:hypothetical protein
MTLDELITLKKHDVVALRERFHNTTPQPTMEQRNIVSSMLAINTEYQELLALKRQLESFGVVA